jgi:DNA-binding response OmpR family regulator
MTGPQGDQRTILLVEDDQELAVTLRERLTRHDYCVWIAANAAEAETLAESVMPDLVVIDVVEPGDGLVLLANLKEKSSAPVIICGGSQRGDDAVIAFRLGASDFVAKPFAIDELEARIERVLRDSTYRASAGPIVGPLAIDLARRTVTVSGQTIETTPTEYRLLCALAERADSVVPVKELAEAVWGEHDPSLDASLGVHLRRLRAKLKSTPAPSPALVAVRGFGYRLAWDPAAV